MASDHRDQPKEATAVASEEPTAVVDRPGAQDVAVDEQDAAGTQQPPAGTRGSLWSDGQPTAAGAAAASDPSAAAEAGAVKDADADASGVDARSQVEAALARVSEARGHASERSSDAKDRVADAAAGVKERAGTKAGEAREKAAGFAASARELASGTDVKEFAASTTSLIDNARPFFLAFFAILFTALGFVEGDSGTSQLFVVGAILFVLAAGFSDELGHVMPRRRRGDADRD